MSTDTPLSAPVSVVLRPSAGDLKHFVRLSTRRLVVLLVLWAALQAVVAALVFEQDGAKELIPGILVAVFALSTLYVAGMLPRAMGRGIAATFTEPRTCEFDEHGISMRTATWSSRHSWSAFPSVRVTKHLILLNRRPGERPSGLFLPRTALSSQQEAQMLAIIGRQNPNATVLTRGR